MVTFLVHHNTNFNDYNSNMYVCNKIRVFKTYKANRKKKIDFKKFFYHARQIG
jgi:hypothetical protein